MTRRSSIAISLSPLALAAALAACGRDSKATPKQETAMTDRTGSQTLPSTSVAPVAVPREIEVKEASASAKLRVKLPKAWTSEPLEVVLRDQHQEAIAGVQFTILCNANCGNADVANAPRVLDQAFETKARPNVNTGDPVMDAVRLKVVVVEQGNVPDGVFRVARVTVPPGVTGPYREQIYAVCVKTKSAKAIVAQAWAPLDREKDLGPIVVEACKTFEIL